MNYIMQNSCNMLLDYGIINQESVKKIEEKTHNVRKSLENQVLDLFEIGRLEVSEDSLAYQYAKQGKLKEYVEYYDEEGELARYTALSNEDKKQELMQDNL